MRAASGWIKEQRSTVVLDRLVVMAECLVRIAEVIQCAGRLGIVLRYESANLGVLVQLAGYIFVVACFDGTFFGLCYMRTKLIGPGGMLTGQIFLSQVVVNGRQRTVGLRKVWIQFKGFLENRQRSVIALLVPGQQSLAVSIQCIERCSGGLFQGSVVFLNGGQRLAEPRAQLRRNTAQRVHHIFLATRFGLFFGDGLTVVTTDRRQFDEINSTQAGDRPLYCRLASSPLADFD